MMVQVLILLVGFFLLVKGADWFVEGAASIAKKLGIPQLVIGLTIVAMGTSLPEAAVSITAALDNNAGITIGNIVGSNILNILIILGITAVITNVSIQKSTFCYEIPFMLIIIWNYRFQDNIYGGRYFLDFIFALSRIPLYYVKKGYRAGRRECKRYTSMEMSSFHGAWRSYGSNGK